MKVKWLIEDYEHDSSLEPLMAQIKKQGMDLEVCKYEPWESGTFDQFDDEDCVVFYGTLNLGRQLQKDKKWIPGVYCNFKDLCCKTYYSHWGKYLFNQDYIMLPFLEIKRRQDWVFNEYGIDNCIFIRPDSGAKTFTGQILKKENIDKEFKLFENYAGKPLDEIITIISSPKVIDEEWRIVVVNGEPVASSRYKKNDKLDIREGCPVDAWLLARKIAKEEWQPDRAYTLDICSSNSGYYLLEANSFSCSGLYECNPKAIVEAINKIAVEDWKEVWDEITIAKDVQ